jgi:hypothetical protein
MQTARSLSSPAGFSAWLGRRTEYTFELEVEGVDVLVPEVLDALVAACGDIVVGRSDGRQLIDLSRSDRSIVKAVRNAVSDVEGAVPGLRAIRCHLAPETLGRPGVMAEIMAAARHPTAVVRRRRVDKRRAARWETEMYAAATNVALAARGRVGAVISAWAPDRIVAGMPGTHTRK